MREAVPGGWLCAPGDAALMHPRGDRLAFYPLDNISNLHDGYRRVFSVANRRLLLLQHAGELHLVDNICPHAGYPLVDGRILGSDIRCPMHGYRFNLVAGDCVFSSEGPCRALDTFELVRQGSEIGVSL